MTADLLLMLIILLLVVYSYTTTQNQFAATASALRQIWSGGCPLSCRHSDHSRITLTSRPESQTTQCRTDPPHPGHHAEGMGCACDNCPCALIENFIRSCRPASTIQAQFLSCTSNCLQYFIQMMIGVFEFLYGLVQGLLSSHQHALITEKGGAPSEENLSAAQEMALKSKRFADRSLRSSKEEKLDSETEKKILIDAEKSVAKQINKAITDEKSVTRQINKVVTDEPGLPPPPPLSISKKQSDKKEVSKETNKTKDGKKRDWDVVFEDDKSVTAHPTITNQGSEISPAVETATSTSSAPKNHCSKCIEKGRPCLKECPKANKNKK